MGALLLHKWYACVLIYQVINYAFKKARKQHETKNNYNKHNNSTDKNFNNNKILTNMSGIGAIIGAGLGIAQGEINNQHNKESQNNAYKKQRALNKQGSELALQMWKDTNYSAQRRELEKAGLSTGLLYGGGGGGGATTNTGSGGSAPMQAPSNIDIGGMAIQGQQAEMQLQLAKAQKENIEANTNKTNVETSNIEEPTRANVSKTLSERDKQELENEKNRDTLKEQKENIVSESVLARNAAQISTQTREDNIRFIKANALGRELENALTEVKTEATEQEIKNMKQQVRKMQAEISQTWTSLSQKEKEIKLHQWETELKAMYPNLGQVWGGKINEALRDIDEMRGELDPNYHGKKK